MIERTVEAVAPHRRRRTASAASLGLAVVALSALLLIGCTAGTPGSSERGSTDPTGTTQEALTTCSVLGASGDAMLSDPPMNGNFGTQPILRAGGKDEGLVRFELGTIPSSAAIDSATLKLYVSGSGSDAPVNLHRATAAWAESTVTYASFGQHFDAAVLGSVLVTSPNVQKSVDVTSLVTGWVTGAQPNFGVLLEANSTSKKTIFVSREGGTAEQKPALQVCYTVPDDHCSPNPCHNGATCENGPSGFVCHCAAGYTDTTCGTNINDCAGSPCQNGGTCTDGLNSYSCACAAGFTGANCGCSTDLQCLALSPLTPFCRGGGRCGGCANDAECNASNPASPVCITSGPRAGACGLCASDSQCRGVNSANPVCGAGGCRACIDDNDCKAFPDATICTPSGSCEATFDACGANPCRNGGVCEDQGETSYACHCLPGYNGVNCETLINNCESQPCLNGAACTNAVNSYVCTCAAGFAGANCEINIDDCAHQPCKNGGTCIDGIRAYTCSCPPDWGGAICDVNLNTCSQTPCLNGSACTNGFGNYTCACAAGFTGTNCEIDINDCAPNPCQNGGVCVDGVNNYTCQCVSGYTGTNCETRSSLLGTLAANPSTAVADGVSATILTLTVTDIGGNPISGQSVVFSSTGVGNHLVTSGVTAANGAVTAALSSTKAETKTVTAAFGGASATADVTFVAGPAAATQSTFVASPSSVAADGVSTTTLTLTVKDTHGNLVGSGQSVFLSSTGSANTFSSVSGVTDAGGVFTSTLSSNEAEVKTVTASSVAGFAKSTSVTFVTACPPDWGGAACDVNLNTCSQNPCLNGSTCANGYGNYTCGCAPGYSGTNCEIDINDCAPNPCQHGGICVDGVNAHACTCSAGFTGLDCQDVATCSAAATAIQIFSTSPTTMVGCAGAVISPAAATLCAPTCHVCTSDEWNTNRGVTVPIHNYWTSTLLGYSLNGGACAAIPATSSPPGSCPAGDGFGVCSSMQPDPEGNKCNLTNCGYLTPTPNAYLGGCNQGSSGALCCCP